MAISYKILQNELAAPVALRAALEKILCPPAPRIYRMPWVDWPAVGADPSRVAARFLAFLRALVVQLTKRLKLAEKEFLLITFMWLDVICDRCSIDAPIFQAHLAQWLRT
jgi:hypothetical protein